MVALFLAAALNLHLQPCTIAGAKARCGTFDVRESPKTQRVIALKVIVLEATEHNDSAIFPFSGGPGEPITPGAEDEVKFFGAELRRHDVVLVDQRGTGGSAPLECPGAEKAHKSELIEGELFPLDFVRDCRREIERHAYPPAYTTPRFADDVDALRSALGYGAIDIVGLSYGTRSALTFLERHAKSVRTLLLEGPLPPDNPMPLNASRDAQGALDRIIADCRAEAACSAAFPNVAGDLARTLAALDAKPAHFDAGGYHVTMSRGMFSEFLRLQLYAAERQRPIPLMLHRAAAGDWSWIGPYWLRYRGSWYDHFGLFMTASCSGDVRWIDPGTTDDYRVRRQMAACEAWTPGRVPRVNVLAADVPVLIITGDRDPVTPPRWAASLQRQLKRAKSIVLANSGHVEINPCAAKLEVDFFDAGSFDRLDDSCAKAIPRKPYLTEFSK